MIVITNETITIPFVQICTPHGFWTGFVVGGIFVLVLYFLIKLIDLLCVRK